MLAPGTLVGDRFAIETPTGAGGFGTVYRAHDARTGRAVAVKVMHAGRADALDAARFAREAQLLQELEHPHVVAYVAHGCTAEGRDYLAMEWLDGENLAQRLEREPLRMDEAIRVLRGAASGLAEAHRRGIVHRDLKPSNVLLRDGSVDGATLLDLGIARRAGLSVTRSGQMVGTPRYMSPEQGWGREVGPAADVFALGCVLFECIGGIPAFSAEHPAAILAKVLFEDAPSLLHARADTPPALVALVASMLARDPLDRPRDGEALLTALGDLPEMQGGAAPARQGPPALGRDELRLASVLVAGLCSTVAERDQQIQELRARASYVEHRESDGALVATFLHRSSSAADEATNAADAGRRLREAHPSASVAVVTGRVRETPGSDGELLGRASSLLATVSGTVALDSMTAALLEGRFPTGVRQGVAVLVAGPVADLSRPLLGRPTPCVGRDQELSALESMYHACVDERAGRAVLVTGEAGAGKSRLRHELARRLECAEAPPRVLMGRAAPGAQGASYGVLGLALRALFRDETGPLDYPRLRDRVGASFPTDDAERIATFLGAMMGLPLPNGARLEAARSDPRAMRAQMVGAWLDLLRAECIRTPVALLVEDLQWADAASLDLLAATLRDLVDVPFLLVGFARPGPWRSGWQAPQSLRELVVPPLDKRACVRLTREILGETVALPVIERLVERSAGNALFLEELIRAAHQGDDGAAPATVVAMLQARIGRLEPAARRVLRVASIFGERFDEGAVFRLFDDETSRADFDQAVSDLVREEVLEQRRGEQLFGGTVLRFRHALMCEAAYDLVTEDDRVRGHRAAAALLLGLDGEPAVVAEHQARGGDVEAAGTSLERAAEHAYQRADFETAGRLSERGLSLGVSGPVRGALLAVEANRCVRTWDWQAGLVAGQEAVRLLVPGSAWWCRAVTALIAFHAYRNDRPAAALLAEAALRTAPDAAARLHYVDSLAHVASASIQIGSTIAGRDAIARIEEVAPDLADYPGVHAFVTLIRCTLLRHTSDDMAAQIALARTAVRRFAEGGGDPLAALLARDNLGEVLCRAGQRAEGEEILRSALESALGMPHAYARTHVAIAFAHGLLVREEAEADVEAEALARSVLGTAGISAGFEAMARHVLAQLLGRRGARDEAAREADRAIALSAHTPVRRLQMLGCRAKLCERPDDALQAVELALATLEELGEGGYAEAPSLLAAAEVLFANGHPERARRTVRRARDGLRARAARFDDRDRALFGAVPLHRRIEAWSVDQLD